MIRGNGIRATRLCDMHHDDVHGPGEHLSDKLPMIALIQQDYTGKKKEARKRMMGMWRHVEWHKCGTGMIAASLVVSETTLIYIFDTPVATEIGKH